MVKRKNTILVLIVLILFIWLFSYTSTKNNNKDLIKIIERNENIKGITIIKKVIDRNDLFVLFKRSSGKVQLERFSKDIFLRNYYHLRGGSYTSSRIGIYNVTSGNPPTLLITLYGENASLDAAKVDFTIGNVTYSENISSQKYVLSVYRLYDKPLPYDIELFDHKGIEIPN